MIPPFTSAGLLPPFMGPGPASGVAPYNTDPLELVQRYATSSHRVQLLQGFFQWRAQLAALGISGLQWINGSFCEDIEASAGRPPADIDVVTFVMRPQAHSSPLAWTALVNGSPHLFTPRLVKQQFSCDAYVVDVMIGPRSLLDQSIYWFGLFSHKRVTLEWKGLLSLELPGNDAPAVAQLAGLAAPNP